MLKEPLIGSRLKDSNGCVIMLNDVIGDHCWGNVEGTTHGKHAKEFWELFF